MNFPATISYSKLDTFRKCPTLFLKTYLEEGLPFPSNINLVCGSAIADGLHAARLSYGQSSPHAVADGMIACWHSYIRNSDGIIAKNHPKGLPNTLIKLHSYLTEYFPFGNEVYSLSVTERGAEAEFSANAVLHPSLVHPVSGDPILYSVRYDARVRNDILGYGILDDKSTVAISDNWINQWNLSGQMQGYLFVDKFWNNPPAEFVIIRGIPMTKGDSPMVELPPIYYSEVNQKEWLADTIETVQDMLRCYEGARRWTKARNWTCGGCPANSICLNEIL